MMGVMTLALSVFSIVPMSLSLVNRQYLARVIVHMLDKYGQRGEGEKEDAPQQSQVTVTIFLQWMIVYICSTST